MAVTIHVGTCPGEQHCRGGALFVPYLELVQGYLDVELRKRRRIKLNPIDVVTDPFFRIAVIALLPPYQRGHAQPAPARQGA